MAIFLPDTNLLLEFKHPSEIAWGDIAPGDDHIELHLTLTVVDELDSRKNKGGDPKSQRARDYSAIIGKMVRDDLTVYELKSRKPRVTLHILPIAEIDFSRWPYLKKDKPDHNIIAEAAVFIEKEPSALILSDDNTLTLFAKKAGVPFKHPPGDWRRASTDDPNLKKISSLEAELRKLKDSRPIISAGVLTGRPAVPVSVLRINPINYSQATEAIDALVETLAQKYPMATSFPTVSPPKEDMPDLYGRTVRALRGSWYPPSGEEINSYKTRAYPGWLADIRKSLLEEKQRLQELSQHVSFAISISNTGIVNATSLRLSMRVEGDVLLLEYPPEAKPGFTLTKPPQPPQGGYRQDGIAGIPKLFGAESAFGAMHNSKLPSLDLISSLTRAQKPDPSAFRKMQARDEHTLAYLCDAFAHGNQPIKLWFAILALPDASSPARLSVRIEASNLPTPVCLECKVLINPVTRPLEDDLKDLMRSA